MGRKRKAKTDNALEATEEKPVDASKDNPPAEKPAEQPKPEQPKLRSVDRISLPGVEARLIDDQHAMGIQFDFSNKDEIPSLAVRNIVKDGHFSRDFGRGQWRKRISRDCPSQDRSEAHDTFVEAVEQMRKEREDKQR